MKTRTFLCGGLATLASCLAAHAQVFTGPYGPGGTWNAYKVVTVPVTWEAAAAASKAATAASTGLPALSTNNATGHLVQISNEDENTFVALIAAQTANSGNSAVWLGANDNDQEGNFVWDGTTGGSGPNGEQVLDDSFTPWFTGEPNNAGTENAAEMRADGRWNDNKHNLATTTRKYVIEWEIGAAAPIVGAQQHPVYYTAPYGAGGKWNLYRVVATGTETFATAHTAAIQSTAGSTGVAGVNNTALTGHLISINSDAENSFLYRITGMNGANTITTWLGLTDDPAYGGTEAGSSKTTGWVWAGTTEPFTFQKFRTRYPNNAEEPNNGATGGEQYVEMQSTTAWWNDIANTATLRRYVIEWNTEQDAPISGAAQAAPILQAPLPALANADAAGTWAIKTWRGAANTTSSAAGGNLWNALGVIYGHSTGATTAEGTAPVMNCTDGVNASDTAGARSVFGQFWPRLAYVGDINGDDNQLVILGKTKVVIPAAGRYMFNVHSDDGFYFRISGGAPGAFTLEQVDGLGYADPGETGAFYYTANSDATGARGVYNFATAGTYQVDFIGNEGTGGSFFEVSWAAAPAGFVPGSVVGDWGADWKLLGGPQGGTALMPAGDLNVPAAAGNQWSVAGTPSNTATTSAYPTLQSALTALQTGTPVTGTYPVINFTDPEEGGNRGRFSNDQPFISNVVNTADNNFVIGARGKFTAPEAGLYTIGVHADDFFALRVKGGPVWRGRVWGVTSQGHIDSNDSTTIYWPVASADSNVRAVLSVPAAGTYDLDFIYAEGTGGAAAEVYAVKGVALTDADSTDWQLIGDQTALVPVLPASLANAPDFGNKLWGVHAVHDTALELLDVTDAVAALQDSGNGTHTLNATVPALNFIDAYTPGAGGIFAGDYLVPGSPDQQSAFNFALHARGRIQVDTPGRYTFGVKSSDGFALRIKNGKWVTWNGNAGIDPADPSTLSYGQAKPAPANNASNDRTSRGSIDLTAGIHEVEFVTYNLELDFHAEVYVVPGSNAGTGEYAAVGTANEGGAGLSLNGAWRLLGHEAKASGLGLLRMESGWKVEQSVPQAAAPPSWSTLTGADNWLSPGGAPTITTANNVVQINYNDPGFGGPGTIPNDRPNPTNTMNGTTNVDDNYYATRMTGTIVVDTPGTYAIGFQSDDGQYFEFLERNGGTVPSFTRLTGNATRTGTIVDSSEGNTDARMEVGIGTGNSRLIGEVTLEAGTYPVRAVWFEGTGGSYNEIFAAPTPADGRPMTLLMSGETPNVTDVSGLPLAAGGIEPPVGTVIQITNLVVNAQGALEITFESEAGRNYLVESNTSLTGAWTTVVPALNSAGTSTVYTTPVINAATTPRLFWRITRNPN